MKILVCGGRDFSDRQLVEKVLDDVKRECIKNGSDVDCLVHGGARGADTLAHNWSKDREIDKVVVYNPAWSKWDKAAGQIRNARMFGEEKPDIVVAFPGGRGTRGMTDIARKSRTCKVLVIDAHGHRVSFDYGEAK